METIRTVPLCSFCRDLEVACGLLGSAIDDGNCCDAAASSSQPQNASDGDLRLPDDIWRSIFSFVGRGHYRFVAGSSRRFHQLYCSLFELEGCFPTPQQQRLSQKDGLSKLKTSMGSVVESVSRCQLYLNEKQVAQQDELLRRRQEQEQSDKFSSYRKSRINEKLDDILVRIARFASLAGNVDVLDFVVQKAWGDFLQRDGTICRNAALNGHIHVLDYLRRQNFMKWDEWTCITAAQAGNLNVLKWAILDQNILWHPWTCTYAAQNGHFDVVIWCRSHDCPWDALTCRLALQNGHTDIAQWAIDNGCPQSTLLDDNLLR